MEKCMKILNFLSKHVVTISAEHITAVQKGNLFGLPWFFNVVERSLFCLSKLHLFDETYSKNSNNVKYYYNLK